LPNRNGTALCAPEGRMEERHAESWRQGHRGECRSRERRQQHGRISSHNLDDPGFGPENGHAMTVKSRLILTVVFGLLLCAAAVSMIAGQGRGQGAGAAAVQPAEPTPRWPDGRVNLGSTSDMKGYWEVRPGLG